MPQNLPPLSPVRAGPTGRPILIAVAALAGVLAAGAALLWMRHGAAVFLHTIMSGIAACL